MATLLVAAAFVAVIAWLAGQPLLARYRRKRLLEAPFPAAWRAILRRNIARYRHLPADVQARLRDRIKVFVAEKDFIGCDGQRINAEVRVTIAAEACLLQLHRPVAFPGLREILVYPSAFVVERVRPEPSGVLQETRHALAGESWARGQVVLSWADVVAGAAIADDGRNVVIHEFAHQLDQEKGYANGAPWLGGAQRHGRWSQVMGEEFARLRVASDSGMPTLLSPYGATDPAEFFAVASEVFFEQPARLAAEHPALYDELERYYQARPLDWAADTPFRFERTS